jgi:hypothetical protein
LRWLRISDSVSRAEVALVHDENGRILEKGARNADALTLSAREHHATLADDRVVSFRQAARKLITAGGLGRFDHFRIARVRPAETNVVHDTRVTLSTL